MQPFNAAPAPGSTRRYTLSSFGSPFGKYNPPGGGNRRLQKSVTNRRSEKLKSPPPHIPAHGLGLGRRYGNSGQRPEVSATGFPSGKNDRTVRAELLPHDEKQFRIGKRCLNLQPAFHDARWRWYMIVSFGPSRTYHAAGAPPLQSRIKGRSKRKGDWYMKAHDRLLQSLLNTPPRQGRGAHRKTE